MSEPTRPQILETHVLLALLVPNLIVFLANGAIMVLELVAGRLIAPYLGMSLYTWTTIIGVVMAGMSLGNYAGGYLADRFRPLLTLAVLFAGSAVACLVLLPLNDLLGGVRALHALPWPVRIFLHVAPLFFLPSALLGTINPVVARWAITLRPRAGRAVGSVFACSVAGSIAGTFFAGFYLIYVLGVLQIVLLVAGMLGALAVGMLLLGLAVRTRAGALAEELRPHARTAPGNMRDWIGPNATVFTSNAAFMMLQLAASRELSRHFGASLYTWTTVIGVVLAGISLGNYIGGRLADRRSTRGVIAGVFVLAAVATLGAPVLAKVFMAWKRESAWLMGQSWPMQITSYMMFCYLLPNVFLGCVSPLVVKRTLDLGKAAGRTVGNIYAWGSIGSIAGTFAAGYFLIAWMGALPLIAAVGLLLAAAACCYVRPAGAPALALAVAALILATLPLESTRRWGATLGFRAVADDRIIYEDESQYSYIAVRADAENPNLREMFLDKLVHSQIDVTDPASLRYPYEWIYESVTDTLFGAQPRPLRTLIIGGGGYAYPHYLEVTRPGSHIEVAEIDPAVTEAAHAAFGLPRDTGVHIFNMDARNRVADLIYRLEAGEALEKFDLIYGDSINDYTVPYHLTTLEFTRHVHQLLTEEGAYLLNLIDIFEHGGFLAGVVNTCREVFPHVYVMSTSSKDDVRDTFVVISSHRPLNTPQLAAHINQRYGGDVRAVSPLAVLDLLERHGRRVLTDNYAPVENLLLPVVRTRELAQPTILYNLGVEQLRQDRLEVAIGYWEQVARMQPGPEWDPASLNAHRDSFHNLILGYLKLEDGARAWDTHERMSAAGYTPDPNLIEHLRAYPR